MTPSNQLISWPVAVQCARDRMRAPPVIVFTVLLVLTGFFSSKMMSPSQMFGGASFAHGFLLGLTLLLGAGIISEELESGHAQLVLLRPLSRAAFFGGRLAGAALVLFGAMFITWGVSIGVALTAGIFNGWYLIALPIELIWALSWLALITAVSSWARGSTNALWVLIAAVLWGVVKLGTALGGVIAAAAHKWSWLETVNVWIQKALPYVGPQNPSELIDQLLQHAHLDFAQLLYDLLWLSAAWTAGAWLLNRRELARRRA